MVDDPLHNPGPNCACDFCRDNKQEEQKPSIVEEDHYEAIELILKSRTDGVSWFDVIFDYITKDCEGSETEPCTCGLESMGGTSGTLKHCYKWLMPDEDWDEEPEEEGNEE